MFAVEGSIAAVDTARCRQHVLEVVEEYAPTGVEPDSTGMPAQAEY